MNREELLKAIGRKIGDCKNDYNDTGIRYWTEAYELVDEYTKPKTKKKCIAEEEKLIITDVDKVLLFSKWINYRKSLGKSIKVKETVIRLANKFNDTDIHIIEQVVNHSIDNQYQGLFWDKYKTTNQESKSDTANNWLKK